MKLNEPLPEGARFDVRLSPVSVNQVSVNEELTVSSQEPLDKDRKEFLLKLKVPVMQGVGSGTFPPFISSCPVQVGQTVTSRRTI
jgi:hypothetical protein